MNIPFKFLTALAACGLAIAGVRDARAQSSYLHPYSTLTLAGTVRSPGSADGSPGQFEFPFGVAVDASGNIYVGDTYNDTIRKVSPSGIVSTLAGEATVAGSADGVGSAARFSDPEGVAVDGSGNVYVADISNNTIRKVSPSGMVTTLAGMAGVSGSADGVGSAARFNGPAGVAVDSSGNVYVADTYSSTIRKITPSGSVTTLAGQAGVTGSADGTGPAARFDQPAGVAVDSSGNVYVADTYNYTIRMVTSAGVVATLAGQAGSSGSADGSGSSARFYLPIALAVDGSGNLYVADTYNDTIRLIAPGGSVSTAAGLAGSTGTTDGIGSAARFYTPYGVAVDGSGNLYVGDTLNIVIRKASVSSIPVTQSRLTNLSARANVGTGANILFAGFVIRGAGTKQLLLRGVGPALGATFGLSGFLPNPQLTLFDSNSTAITTNIGWGNSPTAGTSSVQVSPVKATASFMSSVGAFAYQAGSTDSAMEATPPAGSYTAQVSDVNGASGIALAEIYDADTGTPTDRLVNLSARANVGTGANILIGGFVVAGTTPETVLIRAVGPGLTTTFGLTGTLPHPVLTLYDSSNTVVAADTGWGNNPVKGGSSVQAGIDPASAANMATVGAFALQAGSADSAMVAVLPPGNYTAQVADANGASGIALVEIYEFQP